MKFTLPYGVKSVIGLASESAKKLFRFKNLLSRLNSDQMAIELRFNSLLQTIHFYGFCMKMSYYKIVNGDLLFNIWFF